MTTVTEKKIIAQTTKFETDQLVTSVPNITDSSCSEKTVVMEEKNEKEEQIKKLEEKIAAKEAKLENRLKKLKKQDFGFEDKLRMLQNKSKLYNATIIGGGYASLIGTSVFAFGALIAGSSAALAVGTVSFIAGLIAMGSCSLIAAFANDEKTKDYYENSLDTLLQEINDLKKELTSLTGQQEINIMI